MNQFNFSSAPCYLTTVSPIPSSPLPQVAIQIKRVAKKIKINYLVVCLIPKMMTKDMLAGKIQS